jgi:23S rRNA pseudouridine2605 synthase
VRGGRVAIAGSIVTDPARAVGASDAVSVDGVLVEAPPERIVYALHKPAGVVSTARDPQRRPTVVALIGGDRRLYPVGRLDIDTTGLILLTDDGELAHLLTHPRFEVPKTYRAVVGHPPVSDRALKTLREGIELEDGMTAPALVRRVSAGELELTIHEGRKRQVKRMCEAVGHPVVGLSRLSIGPLELGELGPGEFRRLREEEVALLRASLPG